MNTMHNLLFYPRLARTNMKKNNSIYYPYLFACSLMAGLLYVLNSVSVMVVDSGMKGGDIMYMLVRICFFICIFFVFIILFYINSFIMKRRKREFGLFCILGMGKKHLAFVLFWEVFRSMLISLLAGIAGGILFSQLMFLLLLKFVGLPGKLVFRIPLPVRRRDHSHLSDLLFLCTFIRYYQCIESEPHRTFKKQQGRGTGTENQMAGGCCGSGGVRSRLCEGADHLYGFRCSSGLFPGGGSRDYRHLLSVSGREHRFAESAPQKQGLLL